MGLHRLSASLGQIKALDRAASPLAKAVKAAVPHGPMKDLLSGTWLGHPLHPLLTDVPIGAFLSSATLDLVGGPGAAPAADTLIGVGLLAAIPTAAAGVADWSDTYGGEQRVGLIHAAANLVGLAFYAASLVARRRGGRPEGQVLALAGLASMAAGGYLGGYLAYSRGVGVNNAFYQHPPEEWTPVLAETDLTDGQPIRVHTGEATVLLCRARGQIYAIGSRCSHAGGPLEEGRVDETKCTVECPWHQSVFDLASGAVIHGPATMPQASYDTRVNDQKIEIRSRNSDSRATSRLDRLVSRRLQ